MCRIPCLLFTLGFLCVGAFAQEKPRQDQEVTPNEVRDHGYLFRLRKPGPNWQLMGEAEASQMLGDAVAALINTTSRLRCFVIIEESGSQKAETMARVFLDNMQLEQKTVEHWKAISFQGIDSVRYVVRGLVNNAAQRFCNTVLTHRGYTYQIAIIGSPESLPSDPTSIGTPIWKAFSLLPGEVVPSRVRSTKVGDQNGPGWRIRSNTFESGAYGVKLTPPDGWRLAVSEELMQMSGDAEVGLLRTQPEMYMILICERAPTGKEKQFLQFQRRQFIENLDVTETQQKTLQVRGQTMDFTLCTADIGFPIDFAYTVLLHGPYAVQIQVWWPSHGRERARPLLEEAVRAVQFLSPPDQEALITELQSVPDPQFQVGPGYSLRGGVYRDFEYDLTWTKPKGFWRISVGSAARQQNEIARLILELPEKGLYGTLVLEQPEDFTGPSYHRAVLENVTSAVTEIERTEPKSVSVHNTNFLLSEIEGTLEEGLVIRYLVATALVGKHFLQFLLYATPENFGSSRPEIQAALDGFHFSSEDLIPLHQKDSAVTDLQLGFSFRPQGDRWSRGKISPLPGDMGRVIEWSRTGGQTIVLLALKPSNLGTDPTAMDRFIQKNLVTRMQKQLRVQLTEERSLSWAGYTMRHRSGKGRTGLPTLDVSTLRAGGLVVALVLIDTNGGGLSLEQALAGLKILP